MDAVGGKAVGGKAVGVKAFVVRAVGLGDVGVLADVAMTLLRLPRFGLPLGFVYRLP